MYNPTGRAIEGGRLIPTYIAGVENALREWLFENLTISSDGELWMTETERETDVAVVYTVSTVNSSRYILMIDRNGAAWPHSLQGQPADGRVDLTNLFVNIDASVNGAGRFRLGVITRIDGVNGNIVYFCDFPFLATTTQLSVNFKGTPSQLKTDFANGVTQHFLSNSSETNVAGLNTGTALASPDGNVAPELGDIVLKLECTSGSYNVYTFMFYHLQ